MEELVRQVCSSLSGQFRAQGILSLQSLWDSKGGREGVHFHTQPNPERLVWGQGVKWHYSKKPQTGFDFPSFHD